MIDYKNFIKYYETELQSIDEGDIDSKFRLIHLMGVMNQLMNEDGDWGTKEKGRFTKFCLRQLYILLNTDRELCRQSIAYIVTNSISKDVDKGLDFRLAFEHLEATGYLREDINYFKGIQERVKTIDDWEYNFIPSLYKGLKEFDTKVMVRDYMYMKNYKVRENKEDVRDVKG